MLVVPENQGWKKRAWNITSSQNLPFFFCYCSPNPRVLYHYLLGLFKKMYSSSRRNSILQFFCKKKKNYSPGKKVFFCFLSKAINSDGEGDEVALRFYPEHAKLVMRRKLKKDRKKPPKLRPPRSCCTTEYIVLMLQNIELILSYISSKLILIKM